MTDPHERAEALRRARAESAAATGARQRATNRWLAGIVALIGFFMTLSSVLYFSGWGLAGGVFVLAGAGAVLLSERRRVETIEPEDAGAIRAELGWFAIAVALIVGGVVLTIHPW